MQIDTLPGFLPFFLAFFLDGAGLSGAGLDGAGLAGAGLDGAGQGCRKLAPLALPVPDKPHLVGQNEILIRKKYWTYYDKSEEFLFFFDKVIGHIVQR